VTGVLELHYYTDGACPGNGTESARGGMGVYIVAAAITQDRSHKMGTISLPWDEASVTNFGEPTNQKCELMAICLALTHLLKTTEDDFFEESRKDLDDHNFGVRVFSDSKYCIDGLNTWMHNWKKNGWINAKKKPVKNQEIWKGIDAVRQRLDKLLYITFHHVPGHSGIKGNEMADTLARHAVPSE